eukprot:COSAG02_NODE_33_length_50286_cov_83.550760_24_plen_483_part_00
MQEAAKPGADGPSGGRGAGEMPASERPGLQEDMPYMDWWFSPQTIWCTAGPSDLSTLSTVFRGMICVFALAMLVWPLLLHRRRGEGFMLSSEQVAELGLESPPKPKRTRLYHLDYFRTMSVIAVIVDHTGGHRISDRNTFCSLQWTQQFLMLISGMAFMMSRSKMGPYVARLLLITVIGMIANWLGFLIAGGMRRRPGQKCVQCNLMDDPDLNQADTFQERNAFSVFYDPDKDPSCAPDCAPDYSFTDINFQMGYALMLAAIAIACRPIKEAVQWRNDNPREHAPKRILVIAGSYGFMFLLQLSAYIYDPTEGKFYSPCGYTLVLLELAIISLACVYPVSDGHGAESHLGWILMVVMYVPRVVGDVRFKPGHWIDMFVLGLVVQKWPLTGHKQLLNNFKAYPPLALAVLMMAKLDQFGRCDLFVPYYWFERLRFNFGEGWLVLAFCVGALNAQDPWGISRWLNWWSLCALPLLREVVVAAAH